MGKKAVCVSGNKLFLLLLHPPTEHGSALNHLAESLGSSRKPGIEWE